MATRLFTTDEAESLLGKVLDRLSDDLRPKGHQAFCCRDDSSNALLGWSYFSPDQGAIDIWNLWWIGVDPGAQGKGAGTLLLRHAENTVLALKGRLLVIETSAADTTEQARRFYAAQGYLEYGRIPDFYSVGEAKVIFARRPRKT